MARTLKGQVRRKDRYERVVALTLAGKGTKEIAAELECHKDLVRHYRRMARANGVNLPVDPYLVNGQHAKQGEGNEKWRALGEE